MYPFLGVFLIVGSALVPTAQAQTVQPPLNHVEVTFAPAIPLPPTTEELVLAVQEKYGLGDDFYKTLKCESAGWQNIQSLVPAKGPNGREDSWGISQIHLPDHPSITRKQALDVEFAVNWAGEQFAQGKASQWTCHRQLK